jgi:HlyD family secretion protein
MKRWIIVASVLCVLGVTLTLMRQNSLRAEQAPKTVSVTRGSVAQEALAIGNIVPEQEISVKSKVPGIVAKLYVAVGDVIREGDPLLDIRPDPTPLERTEAERGLEIANVSLEKAKKDWERSNSLKEQGLLSEKELEGARQAYETARLQAQLEDERLQLIRDGRARLGGSEVSNRIHSPASGTILSLDVHEGDPVVPLTSYQAGTVLMTLANMDKLIFRGTVDEVDVGKLSAGRTVRFTIGAIPQSEVTGNLRRISPKARKQDSATLFDVEADIHQAGDQTLRAGYSANAKIVIAKVDSVLTVPERVVKFKDGKATVRIPGKDGKPQEREIKTGLSDGLTVEVKEGLAEKDLVLEPEKSTLERSK